MGANAAAMAEPVEIAGRRLRNRLVATAHGIAAVDDGIPNDTDAAYWSRLSHGGPAMVITGGAQVSKEATLRSRYLGEAWHPWSGTGFRKRADAIAAGGAVPVVQLGHLGRETLGAGYFYPFEAPSAVRGPREPVAARVLNAVDIAGVAAAFGESARQMVDAGYEGVEIHGAHGYLVAQFLSRVVNDRTDRYGGDVVGRSTALIEIVEHIRRAAPSAILGLRLSVENDPGGLTEYDIAEVAGVLKARAPIDYLNVSHGVRGYYVRDMATTTPPLLGRTGELAASAGVPLLVSSGFRSRAEIDEALRNGATLVGMARPFLADAEVAVKLLAGRDDEIRPCVSCNEDCRAFDPTATCTVNPDLAPEGSSRKPGEPIVIRAGSRSGRPRRVAVVGGGPAGLECAVSLGSRGVGEVVVFEQQHQLGGQLAVASRVGTRTGWDRLLAFYRSGLERHRIRVVLDAAVSAGQLADFDAVVWALGATEAAGELAPQQGTQVVSSTQFLSGGLSARFPLIVDDGFGWWPTVSSVEAAISRGAERITVVSPGPGFASGIPAESRLQLMERIRGVPLRVLPHSQVIQTRPGGAEVASNGSNWTDSVAADLCVVVGERVARAVPTIEGPTSLAIGDCVMPRRVSHAVAEGRAAAIRLCEWSSTTGL